MAKVYGYEIRKSNESGSILIAQDNPLDTDEDIIILTIHQLPALIDDLKAIIESNKDDE